MTPPVPDVPPVFVDDSGQRRRVTSFVTASVAITALALSATLLWAVFGGSPVTAADHEATAERPANAGSGPFAVAVDDRAPSGTPCSSVSGTVFQDVDLNGSWQPAGEQPVPGVVVALVDAAGDSDTTVTDAAGRYSLTVPTPGPVRLEFSGRFDEFVATPAGIDVDPWVSFPTGGPTCEVDTSVMWTGWYDESSGHRDVTREVGDRVWSDTNGDGVQDPDEPGIAGVDLALIDAEGRRVAVTTTSAAGTYRFSGLDPAATYRLVLASSAALDSGPLAGMEPTEAWAGSTFDGTQVVGVPGAATRDSGHRFGGRGGVEVVIEPGEMGSSDHGYDLGFRAAT